MEPTPAPADISTPAPAESGTPAPAESGTTADHELLVEEISIDGMCGVY